MRTGLALAVRALWWRRGLSAAVLAVSTVVVAVAVAGPTYDRAAKESVLQDALRSAPPLETGFEVTSLSTLPVLHAEVTSAMTTAHATAYGTPIAARETPYLGPIACSRPASGITNPCNAEVTGLVVAREGLADHVAITSGRFPRAAGEVIVSRTFLAATELRLGDRITPAGTVVGSGRLNPYGNAQPIAHFTPLTIVGTYTTDEQASYWFQRPYFAALASNGGDSAPYEDAIFTVPATFAPSAASPAGLPYISVLDVPLDVQKVRVASATVTAAKAEAIKQSITGDVVTTQLPAVLAQASANERALDTPVLLIVLQLLLLCGLVLFGAVRAAADARGPEIALAKLRRFPRSAVLFFGLAEPLLLVPLAFPLGLGLGWLTTYALGRGQLLAGTPIVLPLLGILAGVAAAVAAGLATVGVGIRIATRPAGAQWRRANHRPAARPWSVDVAVLAAAGGWLGWLGANGGLDPSDNTSSASAVSLAAPALLALGVAMLGSRALPWLCRRLYRRTERRGVAGFLAVRQIARRPTTLAVTVLLSVALAIATFAVSAYTVAKDNRQAVAATAVGAAEVVQVQVPPSKDLADLVDAADPSGRQAMAVVQSSPYASDKRVLLGVQTGRVAKVATWRDDFAHGKPLGTVARGLVAAGLHPITVTGSRLAVDARVTGLTGAPVLHLTVTLYAGGSIYALAGPPLPSSGPVRLVVDLPPCGGGCRLTSIGLTRDDLFTTDVKGELEVISIEEQHGQDWTDVPGALAGGAGGWRATVPDTSGYTSTVAGAKGLEYRFDLPYEQPPTLTVYDVPDEVPVVATDPVPVGSKLEESGLDQQQLTVRTTTQARYLPRAQTSGFLIDRSLAVRAAVSLAQAQQEVWLAPGADPRILARLKAQGVVLGEAQTTAAYEAALGRQGPPLALALFRIGAVVAAFLALLGTALTLALAARRRGFELAALLAQGITRRSLFRSLAVEQGVLLGYGGLLGVGAGLLGAVIALPSAPEFVTPPVAPQLLYAPPYGLVVLVAVVLALVIAAGVLAGSAALVRSVDADRLREYAP